MSRSERCVTLLEEVCDLAVVCIAEKMNLTEDEIAVLDEVRRADNLRG